MSGSVMCGVDGSAGAREAARAAVDLAERLEARLILVHVARSLAMVPHPGFFTRVALEALDRCRDELRVEGGDLLARVAREAGAPPDAERRVWAGDPLTRLLEEARLERPSAIVVGSRGLRGVRRALRGSISAELTRRAPCPVVVVPRTAVPHAGVAHAHRRGETVPAGRRA